MPLSEEEQKKLDDEERKANSEMMKNIQESMTGLATSIQGMTKGFDSLDQRLKEIEDLDEDDDKNKKFDSLESMSRKDFLAFTVDQIVEKISPEIKKTHDRVDEMDNETRTSNVQSQIKHMEDNHPDFWDWKQEMGEVAKRNPTLNAQEVHQLARANDPKKADELDEKYKSEEDKDKDKLVGFGGLTPTSGETKSSENMDKDDAAEAAWAKVFGSDADPSSET